MTTLRTALDIIVRTTAVYGTIIVGLRLSGKREIGQVTIFDLVVLLLLANSVQNAMVGPDTSLVGGLVAAVVLLTLNLSFARVTQRWPTLRHALVGSPTLLVLHGEVLEEGLRRERLDKDMLQAAIREHGIGQLADVEMAVLEIDGSISIVPSGAPTKRIKRHVRQFRRG